MSRAGRKGQVGPARVSVWPYVRQSSGRWTLSDGLVMSLWDRMVKEGTARTVFPFAGDPSDREGFLKEMQSGSFLYLFGDPGNNVYAGLIWLNRRMGRTAMGHFVSFSDVRGREDLAAIGDWCMQRILWMRDADGFLLDVIFGLVPANNISAAMVVNKFCCRAFGPVPMDVYGSDGVGGLYLFTRKGKESDHEGYYLLSD